MASNMSTKSIDSDVFYVEQSSNDPSLPKPNTPIVLSSTELSGNDTREMILISSIALHETQFVTIDSGSNEPTMSYGFGRQLPIIPPSLNDLNLRPNPFNILATMALLNPTGDRNDNNCSPQSPEPSDFSPISTRAMNLSTFDTWETPHTTTDDNTFYPEDEPKRVHWTSPLDETFHSEGKPRWIYLLSSPSPPSPPRKMQWKLEMGMSFSKKEGVSQHVCEACRLVIPPTKDIQLPSTLLRTEDSKTIFMKLKNL